MPFSKFANDRSLDKPPAHQRGLCDYCGDRERIAWGILFLSDESMYVSYGIVRYGMV